jgi:Flp pilus assembly protein TadG
MKPRTRKHSDVRRGNVLVLTCFFMIGSFALAAMAIDLGYLELARSELQKSADSAAMAATWELIDKDAMTGHPNMTAEIVTARAKAAEYAGRNAVCNTSPSVDPNIANSTSGDVVVGYLSNPSDPHCQMDFTDPSKFNAVRVRVRRENGMNGQVPLFFARVLGFDSWASQAEATAALRTGYSGFKMPGNGTNLEMLPFALDRNTWDAMLAGGGTDNWKWDPSSKSITAGFDGVREVNLYPQGTGAPGNRGTVDLGGANNSTADIARQIVSGVNDADLSHFPNSTIQLDSHGELSLNGDTGISAGVKDELASIKGKPRIIPIFSSVSGPGNNANYVIVEFAGVRIMDVNLTGKPSDKRVIIQPAYITTRGGISSGTSASQFVASPVWLVR